MNLYSISIAFVLVSTIIASYFDLKYGIIPNKLTFLLLIFGIAMNSFFSIIFLNSKFIIVSIILMIITFILTYILWKIRLWGGGDVKLFTAIAASIPIQPNFIYFEYFNIDFPTVAIYPFQITVIFNSIIVSVPFLIIYALIMNYKNRLYKYSFDYLLLIELKRKIWVKIEDLFKKIKIKKRRVLKNILRSLIFSIIFFIAMVIYKEEYFSFRFLIFGIILSLILSYILNFSIKNFKNIIKEVYNKEIAIFHLKEGMIVDKIYFKVNQSLNDINLDENDFFQLLNYMGSYENDFLQSIDYQFKKNSNLKIQILKTHKIPISENIFNISSCTKYPDLGLNSIFNHYKFLLYDVFKLNSIFGSQKKNLNDFNLKNSFKIVDINNKIKTNDNLSNNEKNIVFNKNDKEFGWYISSKTAAGLNNFDILLINNLFKKNLINKTATVKVGVPFAPSIAIGFIIAIFIGDISILIFKLLMSF